MGDFVSRVEWVDRSYDAAECRCRVEGNGILGTIRAQDAENVALLEAALSQVMGGDRNLVGEAEQSDERIEGFRGRVVPLVDLIMGVAQGRMSDDEISASGSVRGGGGKQGLQFVTVGSLVYDRVRAAGLGRYIPTEWFLQDIRD